MDVVTLSGGALISTTSYIQQAVAATGGTFSHNAGWFILIASAGLIMGIIAFLIRRVSCLGHSAPASYKYGPAISDFDMLSARIQAKGMDLKRASDKMGIDNMPLTSFDSLNEKEYSDTHAYDGNPFRHTPDKIDSMAKQLLSYPLLNSKDEKIGALRQSRKMDRQKRKFKGAARQLHRTIESM